MIRLSLKLAPIVLMVLFVSCKDEVDKNPDPVDPNPTDTTAATKNVLTKTVLTNPAGVTTRLYQYDAQNRLVWHSNTSTESDYIDDTSRIIRDAEGRIQQVVSWSEKYLDPKIDSVTYMVNYDAGTSHYTYKMLQYKSFFKTVKDSAAYTYDGQNHIIKEENYLFDSLTQAYKLYGKTDFTWDTKGDVTNVKTVYYNVGGNNVDYPFEYVYTYDDKINLLNMGNEAVILRLRQDYSGHNPTKAVGTFPNDEKWNRSDTYVYKYNTKFRPLSAEITDAVSNTKGTLVFTYE
jgi:hypothetical protein